MVRLSSSRLNRKSAAAPGVTAGPSDAELVRRLGDADGAALSGLYHRFGKSCYSLARRICADDNLAEDVVYEVFVTLWRDPWRIDQARPAFTTWLLTLVHHQAVDAVRRSSTAGQRRSSVLETGEPEPEAGEAAIPRVAAGQVRAVLDRLPGEQRQVLVAAYFGGRTLGEIAAVTSVPLDTVTSRMAAGVQRLRSLLTEQLGPDALIAEARTGWELSR